MFYFIRVTDSNYIFTVFTQRKTRASKKWIEVGIRQERGIKICRKVKADKNLKSTRMILFSLIPQIPSPHLSNISDICSFISTSTMHTSTDRSLSLWLGGCRLLNYSSFLPSFTLAYILFSTEELEWTRKYISDHIKPLIKWLDLTIRNKPNYLSWAVWSCPEI